MGKRRAVQQLAISVLPYIVLWGAMVQTLGIPSWMTLALAVPVIGALGMTFQALTVSPSS